MKFRPIIIILLISLLGSFQVNAAVKWNNSDDKSNVYNRELLDVGSLNQKEVPKVFPTTGLLPMKAAKVQTIVGLVVLPYIILKAFVVSTQLESISGYI